ncbi:SAM-dependent methyltransferase [Ciceribacter thiooxidans]|uniref:SAM-dependent methyltransferase n=1 Tax=Ciceribacter thiooxidans TaxID=1969821 RepID=A0ABV7I2J7_9HYPH|nr:class I SAM-dependent methyltransferase [Ciceribacter thiooxidans]
MSEHAADKFDDVRASEYARQSRIALAGYEACHQLSACMLSAALGPIGTARILVVGAGGTAGEIVAAARLEAGWTFLGVDPSDSMLGFARAAIAENGLSERVELRHGDLTGVTPETGFDAAVMIGVLHHLPGDAAKRHLLDELAKRVREGAPLILAGNCGSYRDNPLFMEAWANRWRMHGAEPDDVRIKMNTILRGADPPPSEEAVARLLTDVGFEHPRRFFTSLFWSAWLSRRRREGLGDSRQAMRVP